MKRQKKKYETPSKPWDAGRISRENEITKRFGLKSKKEIWVAEGKVRKFRRMAREIAATHDKEKEVVLLEKMVKLGLLNEGVTLDDVLGLTAENILERRLQTIVKNKGMANTLNQARQMITHGHVKIGDRKTMYPSYIVPRSEEGMIVADIHIESNKQVAEEKPAEVKE